MTTYLTIAITVLVLSQIIRLIQNAIQLRRQNKMIKEQLAGIEDVTQSDLDNQRKAYRLLIDYLETKEQIKELTDHAEKVH